MTYARTGSTRRIRVGDGSGVGVGVFPPLPGRALTGRSRNIRVWGPGVSVTDTFTRVVAGGWGSTDGNIIRPWTTDFGGDAQSTSGTTAAIGFGYPPTFPVTVYTSQVYLNWTAPTTPNPAMDITWKTNGTTRIPDGPDDPLDPGNYGDFIGLYYGDGPPWDEGGKFVVWLSGRGVQVSCWEYPYTDSGWYAMPVPWAMPWSVRVTHGNVGDDKNIKVWIWLTSDPRPTDPLISLYYDSFSNHGITVFVGSNNAVPTGPDFSLVVDELDIAGSADWL